MTNDSKSFHVREVINKLMGQVIECDLHDCNVKLVSTLPSEYRCPSTVQMDMAQLSGL